MHLGNFRVTEAYPPRLRHPTFTYAPCCLTYMHRPLDLAAWVSVFLGRSCDCGTAIATATREPRSSHPLAGGGFGDRERSAAAHRSPLFLSCSIYSSTPPPPPFPTLPEHFYSGVYMYFAICHVCHLIASHHISHLISGSAQRDMTSRQRGKSSPDSTSLFSCCLACCGVS